MKNKKKKIIILSIVAVIVALGIVGYFQMRVQLEQVGKTTYAITKVQRGSIEVKVKGVGTVQPMNDNTVYAGFAGTVQETFAEDGDIVRADDIIAVFESSTLASQRDALETQLDEADAAIAMMRSTKGSKTVYSPIKGTVKAVFGKAGDSVDAVMERYGALAVISPDGLMEVSIENTRTLKPGDKATVTVDNKSASATVISTAQGKAVLRFADNGFVLGGEAVVSDEQGAVYGNGSAELANPVMVTARGGTIDRIHRQEGSSVSRGSRIFSLKGEILSPALYTHIDQRQSIKADLDAVLEDMESLNVRAGTDGVISGLNLTKNQTVQEGSALFTVQSKELVKIDVDIDELDIAHIETGGLASVSFDALPGKAYGARIVKINPIGVSQNNVTSYTVTLVLDDVPEVMLGMSADVQIVSQRAENALLIPIEAIQIVGGERFVVLEGDIDETLDATPATHKVETGITDGVLIEIVEGLEEGDRVAVPQVRISNMQQMWNFRPGSSQQGIRQ